jgi:hypothetical protein
MTRKKQPKKSTVSIGDNTPKKPRTLPAALQRNVDRVKAGENLNPHGRPKGSRNRFAQAFVDDFLADWEKHGASTIKTVREKDPSVYLRVASTLLPKDFNFNMTNEGALDKLLDQLSDQQLKDLVAGLSALGASGGTEKASQADVGVKPGSVH